VAFPIVFGSLSSCPLISFSFLFAQVLLNCYFSSFAIAPSFSFFFYSVFSFKRSNLSNLLLFSPFSFSFNQTAFPPMPRISPQLHLLLAPSGLVSHFDAFNAIPSILALTLRSSRPTSSPLDPTEVSSRTNSVSRPALFFNSPFSQSSEG